MNIRHPVRAESGFSLVEAPIGMAIIGFVFVALLSGLKYTVGMVQSGRDEARATEIMAEKLDTIRLYSWDQIITPGYLSNSFTTTFYSTSAAIPGVSSSSPGITYTGTLAVSAAPFSESYSNTLRVATVQLQWSSGSRTRQRQMSSLVSRHGMQSYVY